jgi:Flp pilus assembly protein TadG
MTGTRATRGRGRRHAQSGQNLVELALTLPFVLLLVFFLIEVGRIGFVFQSAKLAASEGAHAAALYHNVEVGQLQMNNKLTATGLTSGSASIRQVPNQHAYQASVTVAYTPFFADFGIPTLSGNIKVFPGKFDIAYTAVEDVGLY